MDIGRERKKPRARATLQPFGGGGEREREWNMGLSLRQVRAVMIRTDYRLIN